MGHEKSAAGLEGRRILVVEDEYFLADDLVRVLRDKGVEVIGPVGTVQEAARFVDGDILDCAVVDINLRGQMAFPLAERLQSAGVPFILATGYAPSVVPEQFQGVPHVEKPFRPERLLTMLEQVIHDAGSHAASD